VDSPREVRCGRRGRLEEEIIERQATAADMRVALTRMIAELADERRKLLRAYYANALPVELLN
jgi:hypothetical protein